MKVASSNVQPNTKPQSFSQNHKPKTSQPIPIQKTMNLLSSYRHTSTVSRHGHLCSAHVLINNERQLRKLPLYQRSRTLDSAARKEAQLIANRMISFMEAQEESSSLSTLSSCSMRPNSEQEEAANEAKTQIRQFLERNGDRVGENILHGSESSNVRSLHGKTMHQSSRSRRSARHLQRRDNILSTSFTEMGVGTAMAPDGSLCMVQLFRGHATVAAVS